MKSIGFPPGSNNFRLMMIVIIVGALWVFFFNYTERISIETEKASVQQTRNIINSSLAVVFATYAVNNQLDRLNELNGGNPFVYLAEYNLLPSAYMGETEGADLTDIKSGWYYLKSQKKTLYKPYYDEPIQYFSLVLEYRDINNSGRYESKIDEFGRLSFKINKEKS